MSALRAANKLGRYILGIAQGEKVWIGGESAGDHRLKRGMRGRAINPDRKACRQGRGGVGPQAEHGAIVKIHFNIDIERVDSYAFTYRCHLDANGDAANESGANEEAGRGAGLVAAEQAVHVHARFMAILSDSAGEALAKMARGLVGAEGGARLLAEDRYHALLFVAHFGVMVHSRLH
jgi:hypothetical protein